MAGLSSGYLVGQTSIGVYNSLSSNSPHYDLYI